MGGTLSSLPQSEVETYRACTCLDATEIDDVFEKYVELGGTRVGKGEAEHREEDWQQDRKKSARPSIEGVNDIPDCQQRLHQP